MKLTPLLGKEGLGVVDNSQVNIIYSSMKSTPPNLPFPRGGIN